MGQISAPRWAQLEFWNWLENGVPSHFLQHSGSTAGSLSYQYQHQAGHGSCPGAILLMCSTCGKLSSNSDQRIPTIDPLIPQQGRFPIK